MIFIILIILLVYAVGFISLNSANFRPAARFKQIWNPLIMLILMSISLYLYTEGYQNQFNPLVISILDYFGLNYNIADAMCTFLFVGVSVFIAAQIKRFANNSIFNAQKITTNNWKELQALGEIKPPDTVYRLYDKEIFLEPYWEYVKLFFKWSAIIAGLVLIATIFSIEHLNGFPTLAAIPLVLFLEVFWFLDGPTLDKSKGTDDLVVDVPQIKRSVNMYNLWEEYQREWADKWMVAWHYQGREEYDSPSPPLEDSILKNYSLSEREKRIFKHLENDEDVIIPNVRYEKISPVLFTSVLRKILDGEHILVVTPRNCFSNSGHHTAVKKWINNGLEALSGNEIYWKTTIYDHTKRGQLNGDVVISSADDLLGHKAVDYPWFEKLTTIIFIYADETMAINPTNNYVLLKVLKDRSSDLQVIMMSHYRTIIQDSLKRNFELKQKFNEEKILPDEANETFLIFWKLEGSPYQSEAITGYMPTFAGVEVPLALPAWREGITHKHLVEQVDLPYNEYREEMQKHFDLLRSDFVPAVQLKGNLEDEIKVIPYSLFNTQEDEIFLLVRDVMNNAPMMLEKWNSFGRNISFVNIVSPPYLLREYFIDNINFFKQSPIYPLTSYLMNSSKFSVALSLLERMIVEPIQEATIQFELGKIEMNHLPVFEALKQLFIQAFNIDLSRSNWMKIEEKYVFNELQNEYIQVYEFSLNEAIKDSVELEFLKLVTIVDQNNRNELRTVSYDIFHQKYLQGQLVPFDGRFYKVEELNKENYTMRTDMETPTENIIGYRPNLEVRLEKVYEPFKTDIKRQEGSYQLSLTEAKFNVSTKGYYSFTNGIKFQEINKDYKYHNLDGNIPARNYPLGRMLKMEFNSPTGHRPEEVTTALQVLLQETLLSLFPENHQFILVTSPYSNDNLDKHKGKMYTSLQLGENVVSNNKNHDIILYLFEDAHKDLGLLGSIFVHFDYISKILDDYLTWLKKHSVSGSNNPDTDGNPLYLGDVRKQKNISHFLSFGDPPIKSGFSAFQRHLDVQGASLLIGNLIGKENILTVQRLKGGKTDIGGRVQIPHGKHQCDFCGKAEMKNNLYQYIDGREQCHDCKSTAVSTKTATDKALNEATEYLATLKRSKELPKGIKNKLVNTDVIQREQGNDFRPTPSFDPRAIGLAIQKGTNYTILIENGQPYIKTFALFVHELTHIWQYNNLNFTQLKADWGLYLIEGHSTWAEIDALTKAYEKTNDATYKHFADIEKNRTDLYGEGYRLILRKMQEEGFSDPFSYLIYKYPK